MLRVAVVATVGRARVRAGVSGLGAAARPPKQGASAGSAPQPPAPVTKQAVPLPPAPVATKVSPPPAPPAPVAMPPPTNESPYFDLTATGSRKAVVPPKALVDGLMTVLKGRDIPTITAHFSDMEASLDERDQSMVKEMLSQRRSTLHAHTDGLAKSPPLLYGPKETLAFVLHRTLPLYSVATVVLREVAAVMPNFRPTSLLDFGSGPGTGVFAVRGVWPSVADVVLVEQSRSMSQVAEHLLHASPGVMYRRSLVEVHRYHKRKFDVVVANQTLGELCSDPERIDAAKELWDLVADGGVLVITERGSRWGFRVVQVTRDALIQAQVERESSSPSPAPAAAAGGPAAAAMTAVPSSASQPQLAIIGPCPHAQACPMTGSQWCHFAQSSHRLKMLQRGTRRHTNSPAITSSKYSYVSMAKPLASHTPSAAHTPAQYAYIRQSSGTVVAESLSPHDQAARSMSLVSGRLGEFTTTPQPEPSPSLPDPTAASVTAAFNRAFSFDAAAGAGAGARTGAGARAEARDGVAVVDSDADSDLSTEEEEEEEELGYSRPEPDRAAQVEVRRRALLSALTHAHAQEMAGAGQWARIVRPPILAHKHVLLDLCTPQGMIERRIPSKGKLSQFTGAYRAARKAGWGGLWPDWLSRPKKAGAKPGKLYKPQNLDLPLLPIKGQAGKGGKGVKGAAPVTVKPVDMFASASDSDSDSGSGSEDDLQSGDETPLSAPRKEHNGGKLSGKAKRFAAQKGKAK